MPSYARAPSVLPSDFHRATSRSSRIFAFCFPVSHLDTFIPFFLILHACDRLVHILFICEVSGTSGIYHYHGCSSFAVHIPRLSHRSLPFCVNRLDPASSQHCNSLPTVYYHTPSAAISDIFPVSCAFKFSLFHSSFDHRTSSCRRSRPLRSTCTPPLICRSAERTETQEEFIMHSPLQAADLPVGRDAWDDDRERERIKNICVQE